MLLSVMKTMKGLSLVSLKRPMLQQGRSAHSTAVTTMEGMPSSRAYTAVPRLSTHLKAGEMLPPVSTNWRNLQSDFRFHHCRHARCAMLGREEWG